MAGSVPSKQSRVLMATGCKEIQHRSQIGNYLIVLTAFLFLPTVLNPQVSEGSIFDRHRPVQLRSSQAWAIRTVEIDGVVEDLKRQANNVGRFLS